MQIKFLGAAGTVTGSSYILSSGSGKSILIDLGMFQGLPEVEELNYKPYEFDCEQLSGAVLTHAHLDHCGRLPILQKYGFSGEIWMTPPTRDLIELVLFDSAKVAVREGYPFLYDDQMIGLTLTKTRTAQYRTPFELGGFRITFRDAGHILGSASLEIEDLSPDSEIRKIVFSGDLGNTPEDLVQATELIDAADAVVMESTYGSSLHPADDPADIIQSEINNVEASSGALLIPSFSMEKTQELLHIIMHLKHEQKVSSSIPVFLDSPMARKVTKYYLNYSELLNDHIKTDINLGELFEFPGYEVVFVRKESEKIHQRNGAKVIISGSGMMTGGRILGHAGHYLPGENNRLLIVGYQGEGTLGRELAEGNRNVEIEGANVTVKAAVHTTHALSSHADQKQLMGWLRHIQGVKKVCITHGEDPQREALAAKITEELGISDVVRPMLNEVVRL